MRAKGDDGGSADEAARRARESVERYGEHAVDYVETRIEASRTSGEREDVAMWKRVSNLVDNEVTQN